MNVLDTRATLLLRIRDMQDRSAWNEFVALYTPLLYSYALKAGLQDADAADVAQEAMCDVVRSICRFEYDASKGSFRGWLLTVTRNQLRKRFRADKRQATGSGDTAILSLLNQQPGPDDQQKWEHEYQVRLFHWAAEKVRSDFRPPTWQVFWQTTVENMPIEASAKANNMTLGAAYIARSRVLAKIRQAIGQLEH